MADIEFSVAGRLGRVLLNRPEALNALSLEMCAELDEKLREWAALDQVRAVAIEGAGGRAFCAGGDIRKLYDEGKAKGAYPRQFFSTEYRCNTRIKHFPKPYIAVIDGIVMGGGVGVSVHGSHRIVTENTMFAMPETGIGLFPDVGGTYFLPRCPGEIGMYLGLTGERMKAADCLYAKIATDFVSSARVSELLQALSSDDLKDSNAVSAEIVRFAGATEAAPLASHRAAIDRAFSAASVEEILARLDADPDPWAQAAAKVLRTKSPTSLKITFRQIREGKGRDFDAGMQTEWRMVNRIITGHDFYEGTRAQVVEKDRDPKWRPAALEAVGAADVDAYFAPLPDGDLVLR
jgi:enoyl-CoA hydratase